jgi:hypothetical protein
MVRHNLHYPVLTTSPAGRKLCIFRPEFLLDEPTGHCEPQTNTRKAQVKNHET